ncbi:MAG: hypothetical protein ACPLKQ_03235 [Candidatus Bathyarchaeales archaeon]
MLKIFERSLLCTHALRRCKHMFEEEEWEEEEWEEDEEWEEEEW